jgi:hypothetical protein
MRHRRLRIQTTSPGRGTSCTFCHSHLAPRWKKSNRDARSQRFCCGLRRSWQTECQSPYGKVGLRNSECQERPRESFRPQTETLVCASDAAQTPVSV